jgi:hypothetical protein
MNDKVKTGNMEYLNLDQEQYKRFNELMFSNMSLWDNSLKSFVQERCRQVGFCGDVLACAVADWVRQEETQDD